MTKNTETLINEIRNTSNIDVFLSENELHFSDISFSEYLHKLLAQKGLNIADVQRRGDMTSYIYEIFSGRKTPSRNAALQLCFGFELKIEEAQYLLRLAKTGAMYARDRRDSVLLFGLKEGLDGAAINDLLDENGFQCIH